MNMENKVSLAAEEWCLRELDTILFAERSPPAWLQDKLVSKWSKKMLVMQVITSLMSGQSDETLYLL